MGIRRYGSCQRYSRSSSKDVDTAVAVPASKPTRTSAVEHVTLATLRMPRLLPSLQSQRADMSGSDVAVASFAVLYLRARSWGLPAALVMMVAIGAAR